MQEKYRRISIEFAYTTKESRYFNFLFNEPKRLTKMQLIQSATSISEGREFSFLYEGIEDTVLLFQRDQRLQVGAAENS